MGHFPPANNNEWCKVMRRLGFLLSYSRGKHAYRFIHPTKHTSNYKEQPDFIIIPHLIYQQNSKHILKELRYFGFTDEEIKTSCK